MNDIEGVIAHEIKERNEELDNVDLLVLVKAKEGEGNYRFVFETLENKSKGSGEYNIFTRRFVWYDLSISS